MLHGTSTRRARVSVIKLLVACHWREERFGGCIGRPNRSDWNERFGEVEIDGGFGLGFGLRSVLERPVGLVTDSGYTAGLG